MINPGNLGRAQDNTCTIQSSINIDGRITALPAVEQENLSCRLLTPTPSCFYRGIFFCMFFFLSEGFQKRGGIKGVFYVFFSFLGALMAYFFRAIWGDMFVSAFFIRPLML